VYEDETKHAKVRTTLSNIEQATIGDLTELENIEVCCARRLYGPCTRTTYHLPAQVRPGAQHLCVILDVTTDGNGAALLLQGETSLVPAVVAAKPLGKALGVACLRAVKVGVVAVHVLMLGCNTVSIENALRESLEEEPDVTSRVHVMFTQTDFPGPRVHSHLHRGVQHAWMVRSERRAA
jgi:hypothetical protein